jgi:hypothetical protein
MEKITQKTARCRAFYWLAIFVFIAILLLLTPGCVHPGIRLYEPVSGSDRQGNPETRTQLVAAIHADMPGVSEIQSPSVRIAFAQAGSGTVVRTAVLNKARTRVIGWNESPVVSGVFVSEPTRAWGDAFAKSFRSIGSVVGTAFAGMAGIAAAQGAATAVTTAVPVN